MGSEQVRLLRSTINWAEKETWDWIKKSNYPPVTACEEFANKMDDYACKNKHQSVIFSIAKDVAMNILDELLVKGDMR